MDKKEIFDSLDRLSQSLMMILPEVEEIKKHMQGVIEENTALRLENAKLRERLILEETARTGDSSKDSLTQLTNIYDDGFHVCNQFYGQRRDNDEPCMFCLELLDRE
ncbi:DNA replication initiation control protein YabA [Streptococcus sp. DD13]|uniref:DNA replication initiation control protein YabA n=1 Tax=Streptococcus sp. DD13 TaxID=1777881 RepID=UPI000797077E|nr:DNA replication initiation control protein YabA [Streptococcus sp. DD13]KXT78472.1 DNA replication initiation control protein YabA [Streptococcus sp. DD13]